MLPLNSVSAAESLAELQPAMTVVQVNKDLIEAAQTPAQPIQRPVI